MSKHTLGPWKAVSTNTGDAVFTKDDRPLFFVPAAFYEPNFVTGREEAKANTRLAAKAPKLLEALKALVDSIMDLRDVVSGDAQASAWIFDYTELAIKQAHALLTVMGEKDA